MLYYIILYYSILCYTILRLRGRRWRRRSVARWPSAASRGPWDPGASGASSGRAAAAAFLSAGSARRRGARGTWGLGQGGRTGFGLAETRDGEVPRNNRDPPRNSALEVSRGRSWQREVLAAITLPGKARSLAEGATEAWGEE